jgi:hypothetical protein
MNTTSPIWNRVLELARVFEERISAQGTLVPDAASEYDWYNRIYTGSRFRRAHIEIVDKTQTSKILVLHCTIFPHYNDPSPIWGCDAVCGANKITGAFHDMSSGGDPDHFMMKWFAEQSEQLRWERPRELPEWARNTFSPAIIAAGNLRNDDQLEAYCELAVNTLDYFLENVGKTTSKTADHYDIQRQYNRNNKLNPHVANSMIKMGVPEPVIRKFIEHVLFPEDREDPGGPRT